MSQEKEGVRQVSGEPRGRAGEPKQDPDRGAESTEGPLLPQGRVAAPPGARRRRYQHRETPEQKKTGFDPVCFSAHPKPEKLCFLSGGLCLSRLKCPAHSACGVVGQWREEEEELPEDAPLRCSSGHAGAPSRFLRTNPAQAHQRRQRPRWPDAVSGSPMLRVRFLERSSRFCSPV